jgi:N-methylhydantoinase A/oxoprolinase/acetone carboxylase beta subunit
MALQGGQRFARHHTVDRRIEIGAGGGSIARMDSLGLLKVGPDS